MGFLGKKAFQIPENIVIGHPGKAGPRHDDDMAPFWKPRFVQSEEFSQEPFDPVSGNRFPHFLADGNAQPSGAFGMFENKPGKTPGLTPYALAIDSIEILAFTNALVPA